MSDYTLQSYCIVGTQKQLYLLLLMNLSTGPLLGTGESQNHEVRLTQPGSAISRHHLLVCFQVVHTGHLPAHSEIKHGEAVYSAKRHYV